ncbi:5-formyltetrahydrofolate cyclo-ligase [Sphingosinicella microcystinivorans]|uniref:5-formyltetrahydrofolate cyclo-ligase n=1 Tax=Sphingosinicella microcystinivorans TaxID=335406 RepID=UPI0022F3C944|nr:5-formyltetrahydrofolate cyclo-ligase [Sphingosinicella microcystinivorans]WBX83431.1 5-formyltetrahydrofolate cyclo-ligase [Sphingosinicella microcystinivorans]
MSTASLSDKDALRRDARAARAAFVRGLSPAERQALETALAERVRPFLAGARTIGSYVPMGHEIDPAACLPHLPAGAQVLLPWFGGRDDAMRFRVAGGLLEPGPFGTMQPLSEAAEAVPDTLLVPLVAADTHGNRIGQGKGHFDRALAALRAVRPTVAIGLAWDVQIMDALPADSWDQRLDAVVTPTRTLAA